jgi:D-alanine--poly(phosphoribitol) ligase subunit 2
MNHAGAQQAIQAKVVEIARGLGNDARKLGFDEEIPASGLLDSAGLMELIVWFETEYDLSIPQEALMIANFGTVNAMASYLDSARSGNE